MRISFAHLRERATNGGYIDFAVFDANATTGSDHDRRKVLFSLTQQARAQGLKIDASALVFQENGQPKTYGDQAIVDYLSRCGVPPWTHYLDT